MRTAAAQRKPHFVLLLCVVLLGFATKFYSGPASGWVLGCYGGVLYVMFWLLAVLFLHRTCRQGSVGGMS